MFNSKISSGSDKQRLSEEDIKETIHNFYRALITGNLEDVLSICTEDVVLNWGSFIFKGKDGIRRWAGELIEMFPTMRIIEFDLKASGSKAGNKFLIDFALASDRKGMLQVAGSYDFRGRKIQRILMSLGFGFQILTEEEEHSGLGYSVKTRPVKL